MNHKPDNKELTVSAYHRTPVSALDDYFYQQLRAIMNRYNLVRIEVTDTAMAPKGR